MFQGAPADATLVRRALVELTPASPLWPLNFGNVVGTAIIATGEPEDAYRLRPESHGCSIEQGAEGDYCSRRYWRFWDESTRGGGAATNSQSQGGGQGDHILVKRALADYGTESRIGTGKPVPAFRAPSFDDPVSAYTETSLKGKLYLIDFWATWCAPCIAEFPGMTKLYEKYQRQGFEILSYSIDSNRDAVS